MVYSSFPFGNRDEKRKKPFEPDEVEENKTDFRLRESKENDMIDNKYGFHRISSNFPHVSTGYLLNMHSTEILNEDKRLISAVDYYFIRDDGSRFKVSLPFSPYLYVLVSKKALQETKAFIGKKYGGGLLCQMEEVHKEDLDLPNHLVGILQTYLKLSFLSLSDLSRVRKDLMAAYRRNRERKSKKDFSSNEFSSSSSSASSSSAFKASGLDHILDVREHDVPYHVRVSIDEKIFVGSWYDVEIKNSSEKPVIVAREDLVERPECIVLAFDIETTKLPLKFPDSNIDQIIMISYMIDGSGYLITNREIMSEDVEDFEYTPKPEFEGKFVVFNEANESNLLQKWFDHILDVKPHIFVTYNGDFFDWPFIEARATIHGLDMANEIGFSKNKDNFYTSRPAAHMDAYCWVKRDSYLPMGSQNLKAASKAKLRYDPVEVDPEDMCRLAQENPQELSNYSVSDAVATYYLYMKYVHPFVYALCTIIPMEPDEVLRKGSGTLCESLLCVQAFHGNIIFPNKQENVLNKMTDEGHILESETYVGGHVEAIESGVFRSDIPCRFRLLPEALMSLHDDVERVLKRAIEVEEKIPLSSVVNFDEVVIDIKDKLLSLKDTPNRLENPIIYHLDVGAMYPNIILTNRLQPSAMVDETNCAACDFNKPEAKCQRRMPWMWRGEVMPASKSEYYRIIQQCETEKFPPSFPGGPSRSFHELSKVERASIEKKRLTDYCRKAYKKAHNTKMEERVSTICQKENSFYVDTVRSFRDRRYSYKGLCKAAKKAVSEALLSGDASSIKSAKNKEVLYDSLQLAYKCILNSFYGYVNRKGARWYSMEMAGIVCYSGASIIKRTRELLEEIGRPLELDTDGIWTVLPSSFPENYVIQSSTSTDDGNGKIKNTTISYLGSVLNIMLTDHFTNPHYHELVNKESCEYRIREENSIFFEVDGPYRAMILPASKEEGKKLKKRYAVFNFDGSLAELKGFEVKRRGELEIIKIFQSTVFEAFLKGESLASVYEAASVVANYWLDVLYSKGANMPDRELFELISENKSMSKNLAEYGAQKSTSISTAKRLAEFLGDQMVKDSGLSCKFIISRKPEGAPITERAIPLAIFETEPSVTRHYLRRWLKDNSIVDIDIRSILDWNYYIERLGSTIQKIITIPAALQGIANPVSRIVHPEWLHRKILEKNDVFKQRKMTDMFQIVDIEDVNNAKSEQGPKNLVITHKRKHSNDRYEDLSLSWRAALGNPPPRAQLQNWIQFQKKKWNWQARQRTGKGTSFQEKNNKKYRLGDVIRDPFHGTLSGFIRKAQMSLLETPWQIIQVSEISGAPGLFKLWVLIGSDLHSVKLSVPRIFYVNQRTAKSETPNSLWKKIQKTLPRNHRVYHLYEYRVPEALYRQHASELVTELSTPNIEGIYETQVPLEFRLIEQLGCIAYVDRKKIPNGYDLDTFDISWLQFKTLSSGQSYLEDNSFKTIYYYHHRVSQKALTGLFVPSWKKAFVFVLDTVKSNQIPNLTALYNKLRNEWIQTTSSSSSSFSSNSNFPESDYQFEIHVEVEARQVYRQISKILSHYKDEKRGATFIAVQSLYDFSNLILHIPNLSEFPLIPLHVSDPETLYSVLDWQRVGVKYMLRHFLKSDSYLQTTLEQCRYFHMPVGNIPRDNTLFGADLFYARHLRKQNFILWCSPTDKPDLGGKEEDDHRLLTEAEDLSTKTFINKPGAYKAICVEIELDALAVTTLIQAHHVNEYEGTADSISFDALPSNLFGEKSRVYSDGTDETALVGSAFRVMKTMVNSWLREVSQYKNIFADYQIVHFYRWLRSANALLYEPGLRKALLILMKKLFFQLTREFEILGSRIIYADFNRIIIDTGKRSLTDAMSYVEYITNTMRKKELFHSIDMRFTQSWDYLLWSDTANFGGVKSTQSEDCEEPEIEMSWNISKYLPILGACQKNFNTIIAGYITAMYQFLREEKERIIPGCTPIRRRRRRHIGLSQSTGETGERQDEKEETYESFAQTLISEDLSSRLYAITQKIHRKLPKVSIELDNQHNNQWGERVDEGTSSSSSIEIFPILPGSHLQPSHAALEFVKALYVVLSLDNSIKVQVDKLRRDLLKLIGVGEYSKDAYWKDPCISFILPEVICKHCNHCQDIDLCKDSDIDSGGFPVWNCSSVSCKTPYDNGEIEYLLLDVIQRKTMGYVLQDFECTICGDIKEDHMSLNCSCALGSFKTLMRADRIDELLKTFLSIATHYKMSLLHEIVSWIMEHNQ